MGDIETPTQEVKTETTSTAMVAEGPTEVPHTTEQTTTDTSLGSVFQSRDKGSPLITTNSQENVIETTSIMRIADVSMSTARARREASPGTGNLDRHASAHGCSQNISPR